MSTTVNLNSVQPSVCSGDLSMSATMCTSSSNFTILSISIGGVTYYPVGKIELEAEPELRSFEGSVHGKLEVDE